MTTVDRRKRSHHYRVDDGLFPSAHLIVMHLSKQKFPLPEQFSAQRRGHLSARAALRLPSDDGLFPNAHIFVKHLSKQKFPLPEQFSAQRRGHLSARAAFCAKAGTDSASRLTTTAAETCLDIVAPSSRAQRAHGKEQPLGSNPIRPPV
jgi:hypothetical protein